MRRSRPGRAYGGRAGTANRPRRYIYGCTAAAHLTISAAPSDKFVRGVVAELVRDPRVVAAMQPDEDDPRVDREQRTACLPRTSVTSMLGYVGHRVVSFS